MTHPTRSRMVSGKLALLVACATTACVAAPADVPLDERDVEAIAVEQASLVVNDATFEWVAGPANEKCRVPAAVLSSDLTIDKFHPNQQLIIKRNGTLRGLCTVDTVASSSADRYQMNEDNFLDRVAVDAESATASSVYVANEYAAGVAPVIAEPAISLADAKSSSLGKVKEYSFRAAGAKVAYTAPHPFEVGTFEQAEAIHNVNTTRNAVWAAGINNNSNDDDKFHITSTQISGASFPKLGAFVSNKIPYAISFHGQASCSMDLKVAGGIELPFRQGVAEILVEKLVGTGITVSWSNSDGCFNGDAASNFVNAMSVGGRGLELEQKFVILGNAANRQKVNDAVRSVYDCLIDSADTSAVTANATYAASSAGINYALNACPRYIAEVNMTSAGAHTLSAGVLGACTPGRSAHVDYYRKNGSGNWERIGGGTITEQVLGPFCFRVKTTTGANPFIEPPAAKTQTPATFRTVIRATNQFNAATDAYFNVN